MLKVARISEEFILDSARFRWIKKSFDSPVDHGLKGFGRIAMLPEFGQGNPQVHVEVEFRGPRWAWNSRASAPQPDRVFALPSDQLDGGITIEFKKRSADAFGRLATPPPSFS